MDLFSTYFPALRRLKQRYDHAAWTILVSLVVTSFILVAQLPSNETLPLVSRALYPVTQRLDLLLYDLRFNVALRLAPPPPSQQKIVIVDIDEKSLRDIGRWPWSRNTIAQLSQKLFDHHVAVVTFDIFFTEHERNMIGEVIANLPAEHKHLAPALQPLAAHYDHDTALAKTFSGHDVVLGYVFPDNDAEINLPPKPCATADVDTLDQLPLTVQRGVMTNIPILQQAVAGEGFTSAKPDLDGTYRRNPVVLRYKDQLYCSLALQTVLVFSLTNTATVHSINNGDGRAITEITLDDLHIPTDKKGNILIPYRGARGHYKYLSASDVLHDRVNAEDLQGAIVLVGTSVLGLADLRSTPVGIQYPGVESHAAMIDGMLSKSIPFQPDWALGANLITIGLIFFILNIIFPLAGPVTMISVGTLVSAGVLAFNFWFWMQHGIDLPLAGALSEVLIVFTIYLGYGFFFSSRQKSQIQNMFGQYVAPAYINQLIENPEKLSFEGETREMTVMFCDVRNFTSISEKLSANQLKDFLNRYFTPMTEIIFSQQGTIDKYVGDMIMAFWGAPLPDPQQRQHAIQTALLMIRKTRELGPAFTAMGYPDVQIGIGLNTGMMNVGDMGSTYRRAYTVLGDAVNLGSRLESITKFYGASILVSEATLGGIADCFLVREVDYVQVKGKNEAIKIYEPLALASEATEQQREAVRLYHAARTKFLARKWEEAKADFRDLMQRDPASGGLYTIYIQRCVMFMSHAPGPEWQGVWKHENK